MAEVLIGPVGEELFKQAPSLIEKVRTWVNGKTLLVVGPERAGKTSFLDYVETGILHAEYETKRTINIVRRKNRTIKFGREGALVLRLRRPVDAPGKPPLLAVEDVKRYNPACIVVVLDSTSPLIGHYAMSSISWLDEFCRSLLPHLGQSISARKSLHQVIVLMNKWDKMEEDKKAEFQAQVEEKFNSHKNWYNLLGKSDLFSKMPCSLVENSQGTKLVDQAIMIIARSLAS